ncbi:hypothetical protein RUND412_009037 [Rhizina undulata]
MKILFIRHGETVDNVAHKYAGITNSILTSHGVIQTLRLGEYLTSSTASGGKGLAFGHVFSSDLQRAYNTAKAIVEAQREGDIGATNGKTNIPNSSASHHDPNNNKKGKGKTATEIKALPILREISFGSSEGATIIRGSRPAADKESRQSMIYRANNFLERQLFPILLSGSSENVVVVSHGIFLATLWSCFLRKLEGRAVAGDGCEWKMGNKISWGNTAFVEVSMVRIGDEQGLKGWRCVVEGVDVRSHLKGLVRTKGVGSEGSDGRQMKLDGFLKGGGGGGAGDLF